MYSHKSAEYAAGREPHVNISAMIVIGTPTPAANRVMQTIKPTTFRNLRGWGAAWLVVLACAACSAPAPGSVPSPTAQPETFYHQNQIGMFYALRRNADGIPDATTGQNTGISTRET